MRRHKRVGATREFSLQFTHLAQSWSDTVSAQLPLTGLLAMVASVYIHVKLHFTLGQLYPRTLPQLLDAVAAELRREPHAFLVFQEVQAILQESYLMQRVGFEVAILAPSEWVETCRLRCA